jgi:hypothetical protein
MNQVVEKALRGMALLNVGNIRHWTDRTFSNSLCGDDPVMTEAKQRTPSVRSELTTS